MSRVVQALLRIAPMFILSTTLAPSSMAASRSTDISTTGCLVSLWGGATYSCYDPTERRVLEQSLSFKVVGPLQAVETTTGLALSQVVLIKGTDNHVFKPARWRVEYIFGTLAAPGIADPTPVEPKWLILDESHGKPLVKHLQVSQLPSGGTVSGQPVPVQSTKPWYLSAYLANHHINLYDVSNEPGGILKSSALLLLTKDRS